LELADNMGFRVDRVHIRRQRTRWGSCSSRRVVSLNCALLFMAPAVVRYLMLHELAHLKHMNHSGEFWRLLESWEPASRPLDRQLMAGWRVIPEWVFKA
jgi:predicted metal-dependent hydrolase